MSPRPEPHTIAAVELDLEEVKRRAPSAGLILGAIGAATYIIISTAAVVMYAGRIEANAANAFATVDRRVDRLDQALEAQKAQRDLSMRNRDLQIDAIKTEQDRQGKRQDAFELVLQDLSRKTERILVVVESLKERQDKQTPAGR